MIKISEVIPYENNPRHNDEAVEYVANSIKEFGFKVPIIIDKDNVIIAGHTRLKSAYKLGLDEVPVIKASDLTEEQVRAFRLADNKVSEASSWDFDLLDEKIQKIFEIDMESFGFEIDYDLIPELPEEDDFEIEIPKEPKAKLGDVYQLGEHRLMCGDSTSIEDVKILTGGGYGRLTANRPAV